MMSQSFKSRWLLAACFIFQFSYAQSQRPDRIVMNVTEDPAYRSYTTTGELYDSFDLEKQANGENILKNR